MSYEKLPDHLSVECIIAAIRAYDAGVAHQFKNARLYEIEFEGRRYPSKAIVGLAATLATGTEFTPADFSGGLNQMRAPVTGARIYDRVAGRWR